MDRAANQVYDTSLRRKSARIRCWIALQHSSSPASPPTYITAFDGGTITTMETRGENIDKRAKGRPIIARRSVSWSVVLLIMDVS